MKKIWILLVGIFFSISLYSQNEAMGEITSIQRILLQASESVLQAENDLQQEIVHMQFDLITGNEYKWSYRIMYPGWVYTIYAEGERAMVIDTDLKILVQAEDTGKWYDVTEDERTEFGAIVQIQPPKVLRYAVGVKAAKYKEGWNGGHYFFMIMHDKPRNTDK